MDDTTTLPRTKPNQPVGYPGSDAFVSRTLREHMDTIRAAVETRPHLRVMRQSADVGVEPWVGAVLMLLYEVDSLKCETRMREWPAAPDCVRKSLTEIAIFAVTGLTLLADDDGASIQARSQPDRFGEIDGDDSDRGAPDRRRVHDSSSVNGEDAMAFEDAVRSALNQDGDVCLGQPSGSDRDVTDDCSGHRRPVLPRVSDFGRT